MTIIYVPSACLTSRPLIPFRARPTSFIKVHFTPLSSNGYLHIGIIIRMPLHSLDLPQ
ncbi:hypothetical protein BDQ12DRAFT_688089 [Crucibulum laeve]|uniref:Uncharacterized protein n=1 Tax=Crucibulum laeve TaxID=68775 RepID=A0A5C3LRG9_9AGAR|nr:hypothetical protein BDQ12DRAFT_688089 [Crucibulum laeve]